MEGKKISGLQMAKTSVAGWMDNEFVTATMTLFNKNSLYTSEKLLSNLFPTIIVMVPLCIDRI